MKGIGNLSAIFSAVCLLGALLSAQHDYQTSFSKGVSSPSSTLDAASIESRGSAVYEKLAMK